METTEQQTTKRIQAIFSNPKLQAAVVDVVVKNKPPGWSRHSNAPYYGYRFGEWLKEIIDQMMVDRTDICFHYEDFLKKYHISKETLYLRINQSKRFLLDEMDTIDKKYARFFSMLEIWRERGVGVHIDFIPEFRQSDVSDFKPRKVEPKEEIPRWKQKIDDFLENDTGDKPLCITNLILTPDEINQIKLSLAPLKNVMHNICSHTIKIVKINV